MGELTGTPVEWESKTSRPRRGDGDCEMTKDELNAIKARLEWMTHHKDTAAMINAPADLRDLIAEVEQLTGYLNRGIDVFMTPCPAHSGENISPFREFLSRYGSRCVVCLVHDVERLSKDVERLEEECARLRAQSEIVPQLQHDIERMDTDISKRDAVIKQLVEAGEAIRNRVACSTLFTNRESNNLDIALDSASEMLRKEEKA